MTRRRVWPVLVGAVAVLTVLGAVLALSLRHTPARDTVAPAAHSRAPAEAQPGPSRTSVAEGFKSVRGYREVAEPVRLRIPAAGVDASLQHLGLAPDGTIAAPSGPQEWTQAGWYEKGPKPGQRGPAVIVGHVDSKSGPAVFYELPALEDGDEVFVDRADGSTVEFRVRGRMQVAKSQFPADLVYSPELETVLRLVTCGGEFDASTGHYTDNVVVTAVPA